MDTDSVIYTQKPTESSIPTGNYLGEFTNKLDEGDHIIEFLAAGPKNYAYNTLKEKQCCKVRGFTLKERGQKILHFNSMKDLVLNEILQPEDDQPTLPLHNPHKITRCSATKTIQSISQNKNYKLIFDKRVINHDTYQSFPYGYKCISTPPNLNYNNIMDIDLQIYCCKFYDKNIEVKHTYFLTIPGQKDNTTFRVNFDQTAEPNEETVKHWINQPWYHHTVIEKYHTIQPTNSLPVSKINPFKRLWKKWVKKGENICYPPLMLFNHDKE